MALMVSIHDNNSPLDTSETTQPSLCYEALPGLKIDTADLSELSDTMESPTSPTLPPMTSPRSRRSSTTTFTMLVERPMRKRSCSSIPAWSLADQLSRCSLADVDEQSQGHHYQQQQPYISEPIIYQRRASAHMLDAYSRRRHRPYTAPLRLFTPASAITAEQTPSQQPPLASSIHANNQEEGVTNAADPLTNYANYNVAQSYSSYNMGKSSLYSMNNSSASYSPVTAAAIVYLSRRGRRNAIGSASHELILTRRVCRQMPA
ncbi:hypothetical protein BDF19DRAFT_231233 [Syncephalis fuscata]|nr:hypothetical protein BDF19DRAFT_231233 [Syncephalis fuscata]